jgi:hypothetical protein
MDMIIAVVMMLLVVGSLAGKQRLRRGDEIA